MAIGFMQMQPLRSEGPLAQRHRLERMLEWDRACAIVLNRSLSPVHERLWIVVDRLGDLAPWLGVMLALAVFGGPAGTRCALHMMAAGALATVLYKLVKSCAARARPCVRIHTVRRRVEPLDEFSFPSGHTLHAVVFSVIAAAYFPVLGFALAPLTLLIAVSRVTLGLHYPSDVFAGAVIGAGIALLSLAALF